MAVDVKGSFNIVRPLILNEKLRRLNVPECIVDYVGPLTERRELFIHNSVEDTTCEVGVPKGTLTPIRLALIFLYSALEDEYAYLILADFVKKCKKLRRGTGIFFAIFSKKFNFFPFSLQICLHLKMSMRTEF